MDLNPQVYQARIPAPDDVALMPEVMAKFLKKKKGPGQSNKKRDRYVKVLEMVDQCCGDSMITTAALELIEH